MPENHLRGYCVKCAGFYAIRRDGLIRQHTRFFLGRGYGGVDSRYVCEGSLKRPREN